MCKWLNSKALRVGLGCQLQLLHDFKPNVENIGAVAHPLRKGRHAAIGTLNQMN